MAPSRDPSSGHTNIKRPIAMIVPTSTFEKKIVTLPCEINIACRKELSAWSPRTNASTKRDNN